MREYAELKALIEKLGVHAQLGPVGQGWGIEQNPHELATFLVRMQDLSVRSVLEIGTGYKAGLSRFLAHEMGWDVTTVDVQDYGHTYEGIEFIVDENPRCITLMKTDGDGLNIRSFDLVFIDGAHDYENVEDDYITWSKYATKAIAFHDIAGLRDCEGAHQFWMEIAFTDNQYWPNANYFSTFDVTDQRAGIGWIEL